MQKPPTEMNPLALKITRRILAGLRPVMLSKIQEIVERSGNAEADEDTRVAIGMGMMFDFGVAKAFEHYEGAFPGVELGKMPQHLYAAMAKKEKELQGIAGMHGDERMRHAAEAALATGIEVGLFLFSEENKRELDPRRN